MSFDRGRYEAEVIRPLRSRRGRLDGDDLLRRYAVDPGMSPTELKDRLKSVRAYWNQYQSGVDGRAQVCKQLITADAELVRKPGVDLLNPAWWQEQARQRDQAAQALVVQLAEDLAETYGWIGQVTPEQLAVMAGHYPALTSTQVDAALRRSKLRVADAAALPTTSGLDRIPYRELGERLRELDRPTVIQLLYPELTGRPFTLVHRFSVPGAKTPALNRDVVLARQKATERAADSPPVRAEKAALRLLLTGMDAGADLRTLALFQIVEECATLRAGRTPDRMLIRQASDLGLTKEDAELLVASLPSGIEVVSTGATQVRELLADGRLRAAQQALAALPGNDPERSDLEQAVQRQVAELTRVLAGADAALQARDEDRAERLLHEAQRIAADDTGIEQALRRLPPSPPQGVVVVPAAADLRVSWQVPGSPQPESPQPERRYRVVRMEGRPPAGPDDGFRVGETTGTSLTDKTVPVARQLHYGVYAAGPAGVWSRPAAVSAAVVPEIGEVKLRVRQDEITASWTAHPDLVAVRVCRRTGHAPRDGQDGLAIPADRTSFVDRDIEEGIEYFYGLTAAYHDVRHRVVEAPMTVVSASPRAAARPVEDLRVDPLESSSGRSSRVRISWPIGPDRVVILVSPDPPDLEPGTVVPVDRLGPYGQEVAGARIADGDRMTLEAEVPFGPQVYVPFAIGGTGAVAGGAVEQSHVDPVRQLAARRTGTQAVLTWVWPVDVRLVEVRWTTPDGAVETWRLTKAQYRDGDGCVLPVGTGGGVAEVRAVVIGATVPTYSAPATKRVDGRAIRISYHVRRPKLWNKPLSRQTARQRIVELESDEDCADVSITVVVAPGLAMPLRVTKDMHSYKFTGLRFARGIAMPLEFELPSRLAKPYWIRCFLTHGEGEHGSVTLIDPPINELKVE